MTTHQYRYTCDCERCTLERTRNREASALSHKWEATKKGSPEWHAVYDEIIAWLAVNERKSLFVTYNEL